MFSATVGEMWKNSGSNLSTSARKPPHLVWARRASAPSGA
ncbi:hypothetical protein SAZ_29070 [Streptomyces noursei ZPM]|nr:hypothetical protein SAZ_29070 [Streptomyces noursei ZPM]